MSKRKTSESRKGRKRDETNKSTTEESDSNESSSGESSSESSSSGQAGTDRRNSRKRVKRKHTGRNASTDSDGKVKKSKRKGKTSRRDESSSSGSSDSDSEPNHSQESTNKKRKKHKHKLDHGQKDHDSSYNQKCEKEKPAHKSAEKKNVDLGTHLKVDKEQPKSKWDSPAEQHSRSQDKVKLYDGDHHSNSGNARDRASDGDRSRHRDELPASYRVRTSNEGEKSDDRNRHRSKDIREDYRDNRNWSNKNREQNDYYPSRESRERQRDNEERNSQSNYENRDNVDSFKDKDRNRDNTRSNQYSKTNRDDHRGDNKDLRDGRYKTYDRSDNDRRWNGRRFEQSRSHEDRDHRDRRDNGYNKQNHNRSKNQESSSFERRGDERRPRSPGKRAASKSPADNRPINPLKKETDSGSYTWGKNENKPKENAKPTGEKDKPNFALSGKLTEETNTYKGVVIKYSEPQEARKPKRRWRLYPFKGENVMATLYIHRQSCYLIGRDRKVVDIPVDHPSCSKQHAALQYRLVNFTRDNGSIGKKVRPYLIDLESANGTYVNNNKIDAKKYVELLERDVIKFGYSSREYVLLHENSKDDTLDDDVTGEDLDIKPVTKAEPNN